MGIRQKSPVKGLILHARRNLRPSERNSHCRFILIWAILRATTPHFDEFLFGQAQ